MSILSGQDEDIGVAFRITHVTCDIFIINTISTLKIFLKKTLFCCLTFSSFLTTYMLRLQVDLRLVVICHSILRDR
jgi:hypothetical protein